MECMVISLLAFYLLFPFPNRKATKIDSREKNEINCPVCGDMDGCTTREL